MPRGRAISVYVRLSIFDRLVRPMFTLLYFTLLFFDRLSFRHDPAGQRGLIARDFARRPPRRTPVLSLIYPTL